jgi:hypothetical protein
MMHQISVHTYMRVKHIINIVRRQSTRRETRNHVRDRSHGLPRGDMATDGLSVAVGVFPQPEVEHDPGLFPCRGRRVSHEEAERWDGFACCWGCWVHELVFWEGEVAGG